MAEFVLHGTPASPGAAVGRAWRWDDLPASDEPVAPERRPAEIALALAALDAAAHALTSVATTLTAAEGEIVESGALMAHDPALRESVKAAIARDGLGAGSAILSAGDTFAQALAEIPDPHLAARADDVRSLARRAARLAAGAHQTRPDGRDLILIASDAGPADVAEVAPALAGVALTQGGVTAHAAIVARSLGIPMVCGLGAEALAICDGACVALDGGAGTLIAEPGADLAALAQQDMESRRRLVEHTRRMRDQPAVTTDGLRVAVFANVASRSELDVALDAGAEGIGLLRTELAFLDAPEWPAERDHVEALSAILDGVGSAPAIVRVLDFGADKAPPFLTGVPQRGLDLLLANPAALRAQLRAILRVARERDVRVMLPMVQTVDQLRDCQELMHAIASELGMGAAPPLGAMIETVTAVQNAPALAREAAFLSLGTNDLTAAVLGLDRFAAHGGPAHHPRVLRAIARSVAAACDAGVPIEVCGEAASDPVLVPILVGLGIEQLSAGAARVGQVRNWIRRIDRGEAAGLARSALTMDTAEEVLWAAEPLAGELAVASI